MNGINSVQCQNTDFHILMIRLTNKLGLSCAKQNYGGKFFAKKLKF